MIRELTASGDTKALIQLVKQDMLWLPAFPPPSAGRTPRDIAGRLIEKQALENL